MKHMKTLGLLAVAVMAMTAVVGVSSASAFTKFTTDAVGQTLVTSTIKQHVFTVTGAKTECTTIKFEGKTEALESTSQKVTPKYEGCTAFGLPATVTVNNCRYNLTIGTPTGNTAHLEPVPPAVACNITILAKSVFGECHVEVTGPQTINTITYSNGAANDIVVNVNGSGISDHVTKSTGVCPLTVGTHTNATYTGESTVSVAAGHFVKVS